MMTCAGWILEALNEVLQDRSCDDSITSGAGVCLRKLASSIPP